MGILAKIAASFQPMYDRFNNLKLPDNIKKDLDAVWEKLSPALQKTLWNFIAGIISKYGEDKGKEILGNVVSSLKK